MRALILVVLVAACSRSAPIGPGDRPWTTADFQRLAASEGCGPLPRHGSAAFARMTAPDAVANAVPTSGPPAARLPAMLDYMQAVRSVLPRYQQCGTVHEVVALFTVMLEVLVPMLPVMEELLATIPPDDPTYQTRLDGFAKVKVGLKGMTMGIAITIRGSPLGGPAPGLGRRIGVALAALRRQVPPDVLETALGMLDAPETDDADPHRRALRAELRAALREADAAGP